MHTLAEKGVKLDRAKQRQAIVANFVHSYDAAHLVQTLCRLHSNGLRDFETIHDGFAVHACDVDQLAQALRVEFAHIYREAVLRRFATEVRERERIALGDPPSRGVLDINRVLESDYFFC